MHVLQRDISKRKKASSNSGDSVLHVSQERRFWDFFFWYKHKVCPFYFDGLDPKTTKMHHRTIYLS